MVGIALALVFTIFAWGFLSRFMPDRGSAGAALLGIIAIEALLLGWFIVALVAVLILGMLWLADRATHSFLGLLTRRGII